MTSMQLGHTLWWEAALTCSKMVTEPAALSRRAGGVRWNVLSCSRTGDSQDKNNLISVSVPLSSAPPHSTPRQAFCDYLGIASECWEVSHIQRVQDQD